MRFPFLMEVLPSLNLIMGRILLFMLLFLVAGLSVGRTQPQWHDLPSLTEPIDQGLAFLASTQRPHSVNDSVFSGEWPVKMCLRKSFFLLGKKREIDDSNCFSVASVHNGLCRIAVIDSGYRERIKPMVMAALSRVMTYRNADAFNFWNLLPVKTAHVRNGKVEEQPLVRRPTNYRLRTRYINKAANVVEDADDTSLGLSAMFLNKTIFGDHPANLSFSLPGKFSPVFQEFRDTLRNNRHWYNYLNGNDHETGAYLTWLGNEYEFKNQWNVLKVIAHNATFFLPFSECYPHAYKPYIPYGSNDLDGVVNANVIAALTLNNELESKGYSSSVKFIEGKASSGKYDRVGLYYPNRYHFPFAVSEAYATGASSLQTSLDHLVRFVVENQDEDGGWSSRKKVNYRDRIQSTVYALNTLVNAGPIAINNNREVILKAVHFLLANKKILGGNNYWEGGVFFSGGTVVRNALFWKSDAYTTVLVVKAFAILESHRNSILAQSCNKSGGMR